MADKEDAEKLINDLSELAIKFAPTLAKTFKAQFDALVNEGFTRKEAVKIVGTIQQIKVN